MIEYTVENFEKCIPDFKSVAVNHYEEIAERKDVIPLDPYWERYIALEQAGALLFCTVRIDGELVGYYIAIIMPHLHYKSSLTAFTDVFFLEKEHRGSRVGYNLFKFVIETVKERGVQRFYAACKLKHDIGPMLEKLGFTEIERNYAMVFDDE